MTHFDATRWTDYVRGLGSAPDRAGIDSHLANECAECLESARTWLRVATTIRRQDDFHPPAEALNWAKQLAMPEASPSLLSQIASVIFDSFQQPLPAGVRSSASDVRSLLYQCGGLSVDVRLEPKVNRNSATVVGQVLDPCVPGQMVVNTPVQLLENDRVVANATTNDLGEFEIEFEPGNCMQLRIAIRENIFVHVPLPSAGKSPIQRG